MSQKRFWKTLCFSHGLTKLLRRCNCCHRFSYVSRSLSFKKPLRGRHGRRYGVWQLTLRRQGELIPKLHFGLKFIETTSSQARWKQVEETFTLFVSLLMCACVSLSREMELLLRPPTTAISVLKFCNSSSFCQRRRRRKRQD